MGILSQRIIAKLSGPAWEQLRGQFMQIARLLLAVSPDADSELMANYVKFTVRTAPQSRVFATIWLKSSKRLIVGLALPEEYDAEDLGPAPPGATYGGLTKYFVVESGCATPKDLAEWVSLAYQSALSAEPFAGFMNQRAARTKASSGMPSVALLRNTFRRAVTQALEKCEETHATHYWSRCRALAKCPVGRNRAKRASHPSN